MRNVFRFKKHILSARENDRRLCAAVTDVIRKAEAYNRASRRRKAISGVITLYDSIERAVSVLIDNPVAWKRLRSNRVIREMFSELIAIGQQKFRPEQQNKKAA